MAILANTLNFATKSLLGSFSAYTLTNAVVDTEGVLTIEAGGSAKVEVSGLAEFKYGKLEIIFKGAGISSKSNFLSTPYIYMTEVYKNSNGVPYMIKNRSVGFNTFTALADEKYKDITIYETLNKPMSKLILDIRNNTEQELSIYGLTLFSSIDVSEGQVSTVIQDAKKTGMAQSLKVVHNDDSALSLYSIETTLMNNSALMEIIPTFYEGQLVSVSIAGEIITVQHVKRQSEPIPE